MTGIKAGTACKGPADNAVKFVLIEAGSTKADIDKLRPLASNNRQVNCAYISMSIIMV